MIAKASIARHPIHPMLVPFSIGLWVFSFLCDLAALQVGAGIWSTLAFYTMAAGILGALVAALPAFIDLYALCDWPLKKIGIWHMAINLLIVALYLMNLRWRYTAPQLERQTLLSGGTVLLLLVSGWLGGEMVYVHGAGVVQDGPRYSETGEGGDGERSVETR